MRLLNLETGALEHIPDQPYPPYAILSHTWGITGSEITFADMEAGTEEGKSASFEKMKNTCIKAKEDGIGHVWIDNFCINKDSSAELSESINSMYNWYKDAEVCYAYLDDVSPGQYPYNSAHFTESRWFKRGWTLQELIAPQEVIFFSNKWTKLGTRTSLASVISNITKIDKGILLKMQDLKHVSVSKRMSWASYRQTTRREDIAYCLMGLFDVNMPMLYGEGGEKAFRRLQEEIMKNSDDQTLFAWRSSDPTDITLRGLLARSPKDFRDSSQYIPDSDRTIESPHVATSRGLRVTFGLSHLEDDVYIASLLCPAPPNCELGLGIYLKVLDEKTKQYARTRADTLVHVPHGIPTDSIYIRQEPLLPGFDSIYIHHALQLSSIKEQYEKVLRDRSSLRCHVLSHPLSTSIPPLQRRAPLGTDWDVLEIHRSSVHCAGVVILFFDPATYVGIMLGSKPGMGVGARILDITDDVCAEAGRANCLAHPIDVAKWPLFSSNLFKKITSGFCPDLPRKVFTIDHRRFWVDFEATVHAGIRYYIVNVNFKALALSLPKKDQSLLIRNNSAKKGGLWVRFLAPG